MSWPTVAVHHSLNLWPWTQFDMFSSALPPSLLPIQYVLYHSLSSSSQITLSYPVPHRNLLPIVLPISFISSLLYTWDTSLCDRNIVHTAMTYYHICYVLVRLIEVTIFTSIFPKVNACLLMGTNGTMRYLIKNYDN